MMDVNIANAETIKYRDGLIQFLKEIDFDGNWYALYENWRTQNHFNSLLEITNPCNLKNIGDNFYFDYSDEYVIAGVDVICMSLFIAKQLIKYEKDTLASMFEMKNISSKQKVLTDYFEFIEKCNSDYNIPYCIITLAEMADCNMVLSGTESISIKTRFDTMIRIIRLESTESLYLLFTYWRITGEKRYLKKFATNALSFVRNNYTEYGNDKEMRLDYQTDNLLIMNKLSVLFRWIQIITMHAGAMIEKYDELNWIPSKNTLVDDYLLSEELSNYELYITRMTNKTDSEQIVYQKASCIHRYGKLVKFADLISLLYYVYHVMGQMDDEAIAKYRVTTDEINELADDVYTVRDRFLKEVFEKRTFYLNNRNMFCPDVMNKLELEAEKFTESIDSVIDITDAVLSDNIDELIKAKANYIRRVKGYISYEQEKRLDELTCKVVEKIRSQIKELVNYQEMTMSVATSFGKYTSYIEVFPNIFCTLVSAEYLYARYVSNMEPKVGFDYSCISIMYYMSLEDFANKLIFTPYSNDVLSKRPIFDKEWKKYLSSSSAFVKKSKYVTTAEIGNLGYLLKALNVETEFQKYIKNRYINIDNNRLVEFGKKLIKVAPRRNDAAHGGNYLSYSDVCQDKGNVYADDVAIYRGLILELLSIIYG